MSSAEGKYSLGGVVVDAVGDSTIAIVLRCIMVRGNGQVAKVFAQQDAVGLTIVHWAEPLVTEDDALVPVMP